MEKRRDKWDTAWLTSAWWSVRVGLFFLLVTMWGGGDGLQVVCQDTVPRSDTLRHNPALYNERVELFFTEEGEYVEDSSMDSVQRIDEVVVTGRRVREVIPAQRLTGRELKGLNSLSVADAVRYFSGVQLKDYGGVGGIKTVNVRSMGSAHTGVFYDGFQLGNAQNGQVDLGKYSLENMESLSLYNGQKSAIFQTARDFGVGASLYLQSRVPKFDSGKNTRWKLGLKGGSFGLLNPSLWVEHRLSKRIAGSVSAEMVRAHGRYRFRYTKSLPDGSVVYDTVAIRQNGDVHSVRVESALHGVFRLGDWHVAGYHYQGERGVPGAIVNNVWRRGERMGERNSFVHATVRVEPASWCQVRMKGRYAHDFMHYVNHDARLQRIDNSYYQEEGYGSCAAIFHLLPPWWDVSVAYDIQWNKLLARNEFIDDVVRDFPYPTRYTYMASVASAFEVWRVKGQASLLGTWVRNRVKRFFQPPDEQVFIPAVFLSVQPLSHVGWTLRAFYKHSFRMPTFNDLYYTDMGNVNLKPEHVTQYNVGSHYGYVRARGVLREVQAGVDAYYNQVKNKIVAYPKGQQFRWTMLNLGYVKIKGVDAHSRVAISPWRDGILSLKLQYTYQQAIDVTNEGDKFYGHQIPYIPWHSGGAVMGVQWRGISCNYSFIYVGERYNQVENIAENHMQPWYTNDFTLAYELTWREVRYRIMGEVNNVLGQNYDVILNYPMPGRNYRVSLSVEW